MFLIHVITVMKKDEFKDLVLKVAALGVPGVILTAAIGASGYAGAAALSVQQG
jgi:hypothetical protein